MILEILKKNKKGTIKNCTKSFNPLFFSWAYSFPNLGYVPYAEYDWPNKTTKRKNTIMAGTAKSKCKSLKVIPLDN